MAKSVQRALRIGEKKAQSEPGPSTRTTNELVELLARLKPAEVAKTLSEYELKELILEALDFKIRRDSAGKSYESRKDIVFANAKFADWKLWEGDGHSAKIAPKTTRAMSPVALIKKMIAEQLTKQGVKGTEVVAILKKLFSPDSEKILDVVLSITLKEFDKYLGASVFKEIGGTEKTEPFGSITIK